MLLIWQKEYLEEITKMTNAEVWDEYNDLVGGDWWDGFFTKRGEWKFKEIWRELDKRLVACGFFEK